MATLTKKDLLEAIEDMPMDAEIGINYFICNSSTKVAVTNVEYDKVGIKFVVRNTKLI